MDYSGLLSEFLKAKRVAHSQRVSETAVALSERWGGNRQTVEMAGWLHDIAKNLTPETAGVYVAPNANLYWDLYQDFPSVWHAHVGPAVVAHVCYIQDPAVFEAMSWHTTGKSDMSLESQIIYVSDFIEPGRHFPNRETLWSLAFESLDAATFYVAAAALRKLVEAGVSIHPDTLTCYNSYRKVTDLSACAELASPLAL